MPRPNPDAVSKQLHNWFCYVNRRCICNVYLCEDIASIHVNVESTIMCMYHSHIKQCSKDYM